MGMGFTFDDDAAKNGLTASLLEMKNLVEQNPHNLEAIKPYIGGEEVNNDPQHSHRRYVINFSDLSENEVRRRWPDLINIVESRVRTVRMNDKRDAYRKYWWLHGERRSGLYKKISTMGHVIATNCGASPHLSFARLQTNMTYAQTLAVFATEEMSVFASLQSRPHEVWTRFFASSMKDDLRYTPSDCFETFPFPPDFEAAPVLEVAGYTYHDYRAALMVARNEGMTKTYNRFHDRDERARDIEGLRDLHAKMDRAVLLAYGWDDLAARAEAQWLDDGNEPEHVYQGRLFWPSAFRDEVLSRLLSLNAERADAERAVGLVPVSSEEVDDFVDPVFT